MEIKIITVGKIKEKYLNDGIAEFAKRLSRLLCNNLTILAGFRMKRHRIKHLMH